MGFFNLLFKFYETTGGLSLRKVEREQFFAQIILMLSLHLSDVFDATNRNKVVCPASVAPDWQKSSSDLSYFCFQMLKVLRLTDSPAVRARTPTAAPGTGSSAS